MSDYFFNKETAPYRIIEKFKLVILRITLENRVNTFIYF